MCLDKMANAFLKAIYFSYSADSQACHNERQVFPAGEFGFICFNGKTHMVCYLKKKKRNITVSKCPV